MEQNAKLGPWDGHMFKGEKHKNEVNSRSVVRFTFSAALPNSCPITRRELSNFCEAALLTPIKQVCCWTYLGRVVHVPFAVCPAHRTRHVGRGSQLVFEDTVAFLVLQARHVLDALRFKRLKRTPGLSSDFLLSQTCTTG